MINIRMKLISALMLLVFFGCMRPDDENLWSVSIENTIQTDGFTRDVYLQGDTAFIAAGQSGVRVWNLQSNSLLEQYESFGSADLEDVLERVGALRLRDGPAGPTPAPAAPRSSSIAAQIRQGFNCGGSCMVHAWFMVHFVLFIFQRSKMKINRNGGRCTLLTDLND